MSQALTRQLGTWPVVAGVISILLGVGYGFGSYSPPDFTAASFCIVSAAVILQSKVFYWLTTSHAQRSERMILAFFISGIIGALMVETIHRFNERKLHVHTDDSSTSSFTTAQPAPTTSPPTIWAEFPQTITPMEKQRRANLLAVLRAVYVLEKTDQVDFQIRSGRGMPSADWINAQLQQKGEKWIYNTDAPSLPQIGSMYGMINYGNEDVEISDSKITGAYVAGMTNLNNKRMRIERPEITAAEPTGELHMAAPLSAEDEEIIRTKMAAGYKRWNTLEYDAMRREKANCFDLERLIRSTPPSPERDKLISRLKQLPDEPVQRPQTGR